jgi:hypothetical protein
MILRRCLQFLPNRVSTANTAKAELILPWTSRTGGEVLLGFPLRQVIAAASVSALTENGASPSKRKVGAALFSNGVAVERTEQARTRMRKTDIVQ